MSKVILIVDDSASLRTIVKMALMGVGFEVLEARDGQAALDLLDGRPIDIIVSDVNMPVMGGLEFATRVKLKSAYRFTPILMLTTEIDPSKKEVAKAAGVKAWMTKPFAPSSLISAINKLS